MSERAERVEEMPYPEDTGRTHYEGCYRHRRHHNCAVAKVDALLDRLQAAEERVGELERKLASIHADADSELDMKGGPYKNGVSAASKRASALRRIRDAAREALREGER